MAKRPQENILKNIETLDEIAEPLLRWFHSEKRALPWREEPTPYRVWVSEIMLQQTRRGGQTILRTLRRRAARRTHSRPS